MKISISFRRYPSLFFVLVLALALGVAVPAIGQSRRQPPAGTEKKNKRPGTPDEAPPDTANKPQEAETVKVTTSLVNVDAVVYNKKTKQIITGLKKGNFQIFEDGVPQVITNFSTPEAPITVSLVVEYSKWSQILGYYGSGGFERGQEEVIRPLAMFLTQFIKPPDDYASVVAFDMRPTTLTDFTNDPSRLNQVISLLLRNSPAFNESNLFDAMKFTLIGGKGDSVVLEDSKSATAEFGGLIAVQGRRKAMILICSGIDSLSKTTYDKVRKIEQNAGVPIYIIGTAEMFLKKYDNQLGATDSLSGFPGRMSFLQAKNALGVFAKETGGMYFPVTFPGELPSALQTINALLRNQYSLGYNPGEKRDGKQHKIVVKVDPTGSGNFDDKSYVIQNRQYYNAPKA